MTFVPNNAELNILLRSATGPVGRFVDRLGEAVLNKSRELVHVDPQHDFTRYPRHLKDTIFTREIRVGLERGIEVGSEQDYAIIHHEGAAAHVVSPKPGGRLVLTRRTRTGRTVVLPVGRSVVIPALPPNPYLRDALNVIREFL